MESGAVNALAARGIQGVRHAARQLDADMLDAADAVYALTRSHRDVIAARFPRFEAKVVVLREAAGLPGADVADPYGGDDALYEECAALIEEALTILIRRNSHAQNAR
jgi:protein-tyrosine phosphatase